MLADVEALLVVQEHDDQIREIERQKARLVPRLESLNQALARMAEELAAQAAHIAAESAKYRALESRVIDHRTRHEKNVEILNQAQRLKEANAAAAQVEAARRLLTEEEEQLQSLGRRVSDLQTAHDATARALEELRVSQEKERSDLLAEDEVLQSRMNELLEQRNKATGAVPSGLLSRYQRVSSRKKSRALFPLRNFSCSNCDTAIPMQRRPAMQTGRQVDVCEACGVLLYLPPEPEADSSGG